MRRISLMRRILLLTIATAMVTTLMIVPAGVAFAKLTVCPPQIDPVGDLTECLILGSVDPGGGGTLDLYEGHGGEGRHCEDINLYTYPEGCVGTLEPVGF